MVVASQRVASGSLSVPSLNENADGFKEHPPSSGFDVDNEDANAQSSSTSKGEKVLSSHTHIRTKAHTRTYTYIHIHTYTHTHTHTHIHTHTYTYIHTHPLQIRCFVFYEADQVVLHWRVPAKPRPPRPHPSCSDVVLVGAQGGFDPFFIADDDDEEEEGSARLARGTGKPTPYKDRSKATTAAKSNKPTPRADAGPAPRVVPGSSMYPELAYLGRGAAPAGEKLTFDDDSD